MPSSTKVYEIGGKKYTVVRHFMVDKDLDTLISELAISRANREMGIP